MNFNYYELPLLDISNIKLVIFCNIVEKLFWTSYHFKFYYLIFYLKIFITISSLLEAISLIFDLINPGQLQDFSELLLSFFHHFIGSILWRLKYPSQLRNFLKFHNFFCLLIILLLEDHLHHFGSRKDNNFAKIQTLFFL